ncbi:hypothetical protein K505DRAFT_422389 [Melanomma pulvis-pyrius CBS 109.77]|uniref:CFEM domain-containing protein n=1 Tax=Melanomma pulvis-pyrius CBS 109.77 TaxID=1314802 RepID=A0A6A6WQY7_9PLEO|nr:hypothetical protein K505DRAFT_422389 [Melanomma pulvis-pyrius CBS 109.77]
MLLSHIKRLCTILPTLIAASPQNTNPTSSISNSLPVQLQRTVPACAQPCLQTALGDRFPRSCTVQEDISCLCSRYSINGESLGEVALGCIYSSCPTIDKASSSYNICLGQRDAVRPTQTAITVVATMASSQTTTTKQTSTTFTTSTRASSITSNSIIINSNPFVSSTTSSLSATKTPTAVPIVAGTPPGPKTMTPAQIAGLSVAAVAAFIVAIGLMAFSVFLRRRKERKEIAEIAEKKDKLPRSYSSRYSQFPPRGSSLRMPPKQFPMVSELSAQKSNENLKAGHQKTSKSNPQARQVIPNTIAYAVPPTSSPPKTYPPDFSSIHPLLRPGAGSRSSSNSTLPLDQIGLAISAELPGKSVKTQSPQLPRKAELRQQRPKSLRRSLGTSNRASRASVMTQDTVFEEDVLPARRRSSKLLPTPPIPPIRALQPSRPPPTFRPTGKPQRTPSTRQQIPQQPELFLNIPVRHSRTQPPRITPVNATSRGSPKPKPQLAAPIHIVSAYNAYNSRSTSTSDSTPEPSHSEDIPDYYFTSHQTQKPSHLLASSSSPGRIILPKQSPKMIVIKPKTSASTVSRATSRASTNIRDSISSQTSFETTGTNDPTPDNEDDDKQLSDDNKLSPVAESPISNLRYPKVPRASNQLVPRSPRSPQSQKGASQSHTALQSKVQASPRLPSPSALLVKRRGEREALQLESELHMDSPNRTEDRDYMKHYRKHMRSTSVVESWNAGPTALTERATRTQSGQWPKSPAMYEQNAVRPLNIRPKRQSGVDGGQLMSPAWVPHLTPTRQGDDLLISVSYSKGSR